MESISFQYPTWYLLFCGLLGLVFAFVLYTRSKSFDENPKWLTWLLGFVRFLTVSLLAVLLLSPLLKSIVTETKKPVIVLAQDQSESISANLKGEEMVAYQQNFQALKASLDEKYDVKEYAFGNGVREGIDFTFGDKVSNISELMKSLYDLYSNQNLGAIVLASDGIFNEGSNPIYASTKISAPIYTVALGDTTVQKDLLIKRVFHNKIAYLGDKFTIQVDVSAQNCAGNNTKLSVSKVGDGSSTKVKDFDIKIDKNDFFTTKEIILDANKAGVQRYRITVNKVTNEVTTSNNSKEIFVDVLDARQKILILANAPHPDLSAIKQSLIKNKNYQVTIEYIKNQSLNVAGYDFAILHQIPSKTNDGSAALQKLYERNTPRLYIVGSQSDISKISSAQSILGIKSNGNSGNDIQANVNPNFSLFNIDDKILSELPNFAPLKAPFGEFDQKGNAEVLLFQRIGKVDTQYPLLLFGEQNGLKIGVLAAEGIWKWRLFDYLQHQNHDMIDEVIGKSVQYLSLKEDKRKFRVSVNKNIFKENEKIYFDAELYNESYELINDPDASLVITNSEGKNFNFTFDKSNKSYTLNAGFFEVGDYKFRGITMNSGKELTYNGQFSVQPIQLESYATTADHGLLRMLSEKHGGEIVYPDQIGSIATLISGKETVKPTIYQTSKTRSVINIKWIFFILLFLLTLEWFLRRYFGSY